ncbi:MAG: YheV family putative metal-binding protein [Enterobacterales bacterium]|nr:YheV family putative metal-binding protein [Enterobacterales bacterium]
MNSRPQFIAGAVCPQCNQTDSLTLDKASQKIRCVSCNFIETSQQRDQKNSDSDPVQLIQITNLKD